MKIALSLGGSLVTNPFTGENIQKYVKVLSGLRKKAEKMVIVVGGGRPARDYIEASRELLSEEDQDKVATYITHANALLLARALGEQYEIPRSDEEIRDHLEENDFLICGGTKPQQSTDNVAAFAASLIDADVLINASNVDGVYDKDPAAYKDAKRFDTMTHQQLLEIVSSNDQTPGNYALFDKKAVETCKESNIKIVFVDGRNPENIAKALEDNTTGTVVS